MKKGTKIGITIGSIFASILVVAVVVLSLITTKPLANLADYKVAYLYESGSVSNGYQVSSLLTGEEKQSEDAELKDLLSKCSYSVMQSLLSGKVETANEVYLENGEDVTFGQTELNGAGLYTKYDSSLPKLKLTFSTVKKATIGSEEYEFDTVELLIANTYGEINEITCVAWDSTKYDIQDEETEFINFPVFKLHANTTDLYNFIMNARA